MPGCRPASTGATSTPAAAAPAIFQQVDLAAPDWTIKSVSGGGDIRFADLKGKVVVVDFWATWCQPCREEIPEQIKLQEKYRSAGLVVVGVAADEAGPQIVEKVSKSLAINYPVGMYTDSIVAAFGGVEALPTTFVIDRQGRIRFKKMGTAPATEWEQVLKTVL
jgi:thiol-disulfide isomerase/thioredoxin